MQWVKFLIQFLLPHVSFSFYPISKKGLGNIFLKGFTIWSRLICLTLTLWNANSHKMSNLQMFKLNKISWDADNKILTTHLSKYSLIGIFISHNLQMCTNFNSPNAPSFASFKWCVLCTVWKLSLCEKFQFAVTNNHVALVFGTLNLLAYREKFILYSPVFDYTMYLSVFNLQFQLSSCLSLCAVWRPQCENFWVDITWHLTVKTFVICYFILYVLVSIYIW